MLRGAPGEAARQWGTVGEEFEPNKGAYVVPLRKAAIFGHSYVRVLDYFLDVARNYFEKKDEREDAQ